MCAAFNKVKDAARESSLAFRRGIEGEVKH
jgi:hypothetical protein